MAEHSMCHPGRPAPQGEGHAGSPALAGFLSIQSMAGRVGADEHVKNVIG